MNDPIKLELKDVGKRYGAQEVFRGVNLCLTAGDIAVVLGANGAGKTTLLKTTVGLLRPSQGSVNLGPNKPSFFSSNAAYLGHESMLYQELTVNESVEFMRKIRRVEKTASEALKEWDLLDSKDKRVSELSRGLRYRTALCASFIHEPRFIFLDEPSSALDQSSLEVLGKKIKAAVTKRQGFALIVTHDVERLAPLANRFLVLDAGGIAYDSEAARDELASARSKAVNFYHRANR